jgi:hypothetical protein
VEPGQRDGGEAGEAGRTWRIPAAAKDNHHPSPLLQASRALSDRRDGGVSCARLAEAETREKLGRGLGCLRLRREWAAGLQSKEGDGIDRISPGSIHGFDSQI